MTEVAQENPLRVGLRRERVGDPCALVIFGAGGDLASRKLVPALYNLALDRLLPGDAVLVGAGRRPMSDADFVESMRQAVEEHSRRPLVPEMWEELASRIRYVQADYDSAGDFQRLASQLADADRAFHTGGNRLFYLATPPSAFEGIASGLAAAGLNRPGEGGSWARLVVEKPFGRDLVSARALNAALHRAFPEPAIFRIDHYLGKETVQNLLVFRFANGIFEPLWNQKYVDHVQITVSEAIGVEGRGSYYEEAGLLRDMVQNHMAQLLCLIGMEPPVSLDADAVRDEKVKVLRALRPLRPEDVDASTVRGQYGPGSSGGKPVPGYREEKGVASRSRTETYVAHRVHLDNWRWAGVPFYLRAGKRLPKRVTEVALQFRDVPHMLFRAGPDDRIVPNTLVLRIQPQEGISLKFDAKVPGPKPQIEPVSMEFHYGTAWGMEPPEAYERLLLDAMLGDPTLFIRADEVEASWMYADRLLDRWARASRGPEVYPAGSWGPPAADALIERDGRAWRRL
ncbi:MAG TPA: glucose-6-phosphate dehydrogenase [Candidatus Polarisedimenticolaceae bacterium]|nr:glucose-6-phosphate dehydrogenase [Candidatus Polarisedimenticolaceae bacterium]